jgi:hypothetical protein
MGKSRKRQKPQRMMSLSNECWETLTEIVEGSGDEKMSRSKVIELLAQMMRDLTLDETSTYIANKIRAKIGKPPLKNENRSYRDILAD